MTEDDDDSDDDSTTTEDADSEGRLSVHRVPH